MLESLRPGNVLLAALAGWSLALLALALLGLGANFRAHPDDPALAPPVPSVELSEVGARLGPLSSYDEVGRRPLLTPDRRPAPDGQDGQEEKPMDYELSGVLLVGEFQAAMLQSRDGKRGQRVRVGELVEGTSWRLVSVEPRSAVIEGPEGRRTLELRQYDGSADARPEAGPRPTTRPDAADAAAAAEPAAPVDMSTEPPADADAQVQAIRRRIEARRAQLREEAARRNGQKVE